MSQEPEITLITARKQRHTRRRGARPTLVTTPPSEIAEPQTGALALETATEPLDEAAVEETVTTVKPSRSGRLPRFFKVTKEEQEGAPQEEEVIKARLARATRSTTNSSKASAKAEEATEKPAKEGKPKAASQPAKPPRLFKPRHFIGMGIYLIGAQMILPYEAAFVQSSGLEKVFFKLPLFGQELPIDTALVLNIATLIILLYALVKFDFLPSTLSARNVAEQRAREQRAKQQAAKAASREARANQPTIKQGVQGQDDDLYQTYRMNQRREKKR